MGDAFANAIAAAMVIAALVTAAVVLFLVFGVPVLWGWIKPWLHLLTA